MPTTRSKKRHAPYERITSASSRTVGRNSHRAENGVQPSKLCSRCAAIDFSALFPGLGREIELGPPSTWKPSECEVCYFLWRCLGSANKRSSTFDVPYYLSNKSYKPSYIDSEYARVSRDLGIVNYSAVLPANNALFALGHHGIAQRYIVGSSLDLGSMINTTPSKIDWHLVNKWLRTDTENSHCVVQEEFFRSSTATSLSLPPEMGTFLTVIDCQSRELVQIPSGTEYVTLSYVWGSGGAVFESDCVAGLSSRTLPLTVEDSLLVCLKLGHRYLGVDRYCIPQTDSEERDWLIKKMGEIYANSTLTIVACAGDHRQYGLPGVTCLRNDLPCLSTGDFTCIQMLPTTTDICHSVWGSRGWTYQETLLSQKRLYFTDSQLYFEGFQSVQCEWVAQPIGDFANDAVRTKNVPWIFSKLSYLEDPGQIYSCIEGYSSRQLSFESNALNAISGILAVFERRHQVRHIWGMPYRSRYEVYRTTEPSLWHSFEFSTYSSCVRREAFPSWSWLGWRGAAFWSPLSLPYPSAWILNICPETMSGSVLSWSDYENNYHMYARNHDQISRFIHVQTHMSSIAHVRITRKHSSEYSPHPNIAIIELVDGTKLYALEEGSDLNRIKHCLPRFLLIHMPRWDEMGNELHLLAEDHGDHWERVHLIRALCEDCYNGMNYFEGHAGCNRLGPPGTLRTIRLG
jgi:hypothetical protein